jgi:hypothetical protein
LYGTATSATVARNKFTINSQASTNYATTGLWIDSDTGTAVVYTENNNMQVVSASGTAYSALVATGDTWNSSFDGIVAADGYSGAGTINFSSSPSAGNTTVTGAVAATTIELGHASDTTLARSGAGDITVEGNHIYRAGGTDVADDDVADDITITAGSQIEGGDPSFTTIELGHATDTTIARSGAGQLTIEGQAIYDANDVPGGELGGTFASFTIDDGVAVSNWNLTTPTITSGAVFTGADVSPDADGELVYDTTVTGLDDGAFAYFGGADTVYYVLASDVLPVTNDHVLAYNSGTDRLYWKADADSGGAPALNAVTAPTAAWSIAFDDEEKVTWTTSQATVGSFFTITNPVDPVAAQLYLLDLTYSVDDGQALADYIIAKDAGGTVFTLEQDGDVVSAGNLAGATYGSDGSVSNAELLFINSLTSNAQTQITNNAALVDTGDEIIAIINAAPTTAISPVAGGTGIVNNAASTLTISGNFATTLTVSEATSVTLPASGTLATTTYSPTNVTPVDTAEENATFYPVLVDGATGDQATETDGELTYNPSTDTLTAAILVGTTDIETALGAAYDTAAELDALFAAAGTKENITTVDTADEAAVFYPVLVDGATGDQATETDGEFSYNPNTDVLTVANLDLLGAPFPADPGADRVLMWDDSETGAELVWAAAGAGDVLADGSVPFTGEVHFENNAAAATFGAVATDADVVLAFDAVTTQGSITFMEDEDRFDFDNDVDVIGDLTAATITSDGAITATSTFDVVGATAMTLGSADVTSFILSGISETVTITPSADIITVTSGTGVATWDFGTINLATDALDLSEGNITNVGQIDADTIIADGTALAIGDNSETIAITQPEQLPG